MKRLLTFAAMFLCCIATTIAQVSGFGSEMRMSLSKFGMEQYFIITKVISWHTVENVVIN